MGFLTSRHRQSQEGADGQGLDIPLVFLSLAAVEDPGLWGATQAREYRLVENPLEGLVAATRPAVVFHPLAGVVSGWNQPSISGELIYDLEDT